MADDNITGVFDELDPMQFLFPDTAIVQETVEETSFERFIEVHRLILQSEYAAAAQNPNPVIYLEGHPHHGLAPLRGYSARDDENMAQFAARLRHESQQMHALRIFFHRRTQVAARRLTDEDHGTLPAPDVLVRDSDPQDLHDGIIWYAEEAPPGDITRRLSGIYELTNGRLVDSKMYSEQPIETLKGVLG